MIKTYPGANNVEMHHIGSGLSSIVYLVDSVCLLGKLYSEGD